MPRERAASAPKKKARKKSQATRHSEQSQSPVKWGGVAVGLLTALFAAFLIYLDQMPTPDEQQKQNKRHEPLALPSEKTQTAKPETKKTPKPKEKKNKPEHQFDFYTILPDQEVQVTTTQKAKKDAITQPETANTSKNQRKELYQLQVGAFSILGKADTMKAQLAFLGIESNIQTVKLNNGQTVYRVRIGPTHDKDEINRIRQVLKGQNITAFIQKI